MNNVELENKIDGLERKVDNIVRIAQVTQIKGAKVIVQINGVESHELPVLFPKTQDDKIQLMPDIGEQVVCVFLPFDLNQGFVVGAVYSGIDKEPISGSDKAHIKFKDSAFFEYDRKLHKLTLDLSGSAGDIEVKCKNSTVTCTESAVVNCKNATLKADENAFVFCSNSNITASEKAVVDSPKIELKNGGEGLGVVTGECLCNVTGVNHVDVSLIVKAQKQ